MSARVASALWRIRPELVLALDERLGLPVDSYVNGSQTWLIEESGHTGGDTAPTFEWRLHPVAGYRAPEGISHYDLWEQVVAQLSAGASPGALELGDERRALTSLWEGLECFVAFGDDVEPANLARIVTEVLGIPPDVVGMVDHDRVGDAWERARGDVSLVALLEEQLRS